MIRRHIENSIRKALADTPVVLLNGARQTGKTTLAQAIAAELGAQYFTLDDAATVALAATDPSGFIRNLSGLVIIASRQALARPSASVMGAMNAQFNAARPGYLSGPQAPN
jgi:hypothetical protein